jgi:hypothetical protein
MREGLRAHPNTVPGRDGASSVPALVPLPQVPITSLAHVALAARQSDYQQISTSHAERQNLTMRTHMPRFTRFTNAFSKKIENHKAAIALHYS